MSHQGLVPAMVMPGLFWLSGRPLFMDAINSALLEVMASVTGRRLVGLLSSSAGRKKGATQEIVVFREYTSAVKMRMGKGPLEQAATTTGQVVVDAGWITYLRNTWDSLNCDHVSHHTPPNTCHDMKAFADRTLLDTSDIHFRDRDKYRDNRREVPVRPNVLIDPDDWDWPALAVVHELAHCWQLLEGRLDQRTSGPDYTAQWGNFAEGEASGWQNAFAREVRPEEPVYDYKGNPLEPQ